MIQRRKLALFALAVSIAAPLGGCGIFNATGGQPHSATAGQPIAATGLARSLDPAAAATAAVQTACKRLGAEPTAVLFFECFPEPGDGALVAKTIQSLCPQAETVGCSAGGVATIDGQAGDRAVAAVAIAGRSLRLSTAYVPPSFASSKAAGQWLAGQLEPATGEAVTVLLSTPATIAQPTWDANILAQSLVERRGGETQIAGGLAGGDRPRVYHAGRAFLGGVAAIQLSGPADYGIGAAHEMLRVGPAWRAWGVDGRTVRQFNDGQTVRSAGEVVTQWLLAQDRPWACLGLLTDNRAIPLRFSPGQDGSVTLPVAVGVADRFVVLRPATVRAGEQAVNEAMEQAAFGRDSAASLTLLAAPECRDRDSLLMMLHNRLRGATGQPAAVAFISPGQFVPLSDGRPHFASHMFTVLHVEPRR